MRLKSNYEKVREFHEKFDLILDGDFHEPALRDLRTRLIEEEAEEVTEELSYDVLGLSGTSAKVRLAKELADLLYVTYGTAATFGIDIDEVFNKIHQNNMSKLGPDGKPIYREDGKLLKPEGYKPVDLKTLLV